MKRGPIAPALVVHLALAALLVACAGDDDTSFSGASGGGTAGKGQGASAGAGGSGAKAGASGSGAKGGSSGAGGSGAKGGASGSGAKGGASQGGSSGATSTKGGAAGMGAIAGAAGSASGGADAGGSAGNEQGGAAGTGEGGSAGTDQAGASGADAGGSAGADAGGSAGADQGGAAGADQGGGAGAEQGGAAGADQGGAAGTDQGGAGGFAGADACNPGPVRLIGVGDHVIPIDDFINFVSQSGDPKTCSAKRKSSAEMLSFYVDEPGYIDVGPVKYDGSAIVYPRFCSVDPKKGVCVCTETGVCSAGVQSVPVSKGYFQVLVIAAQPVALPDIKISFKAACGDGTGGPGYDKPAEDCDDGNRIDGDGCDSRCRFEPSCVLAHNDVPNKDEVPGTWALADNCRTAHVTGSLSLGDVDTFRVPMNAGEELEVWNGQRFVCAQGGFLLSIADQPLFSSEGGCIGTSKSCDPKGCFVTRTQAAGGANEAWVNVAMPLGASGGNSYDFTVYRR